MKQLQNNLHSTLIIFFVLIYTTACKKGDIGPKGEAGAQGIQGVQGIPGKDGAKFYSGQGVPAAATGREGDMYLDMGSSLLYGPKTGSGWGSPVNLRGADGSRGPSGANGSKILSGTGAPAQSTGVAGDYYIDNNTAFLYGPKTSAGWGGPVSLRGPKGDKGDKGDPGTANVMASTVVVDNSMWAWGAWYVYSAFGGSVSFQTRYCQISVPLLTQDIVNNGLVQVYFTPSAGGLDNAYTNLPASYMLTSASSSGPKKYSANYRYLYWQGVITLYFFFQAEEGAAENAFPSAQTYTIPVHKFKYVIVPGNKMQAAKKVDMNDYKAVKAAYGLKD